MKVKLHDVVTELVNAYQDGHLSKDVTKNVLALLKQQQSTAKIAIIGIACNMPQAKNKHDFYAKLLSGTSFISDLPQHRAEDLASFVKKYDQTAFNNDRIFYRGGFLDDITEFGNEFFEIRDRDALVMDPQQRLFLHTAHDAFQDAGLTKKQLAHSKTGVFIADSVNEYQYLLDEITVSAVVGNIAPFIGARIARFYDLTGPVLTVGTTCSSGLSTAHLAIQSLRNKACDTALVGCANINLLPLDLKSDPVASLGILSPNESCSAFDDNANGIVRGEGIIALVMKRYEDAIRDNDYIYASIVGSGINNDGHSSAVGQPNAKTQCELYQSVWQQANIEPGNLKYIEAHGTGTKIGDPIEIKAIDEAMAPYKLNRQICGIGSIKSNIGHLTKGGAGLAGLLKLTLGMNNGLIPRTINVERPNSFIDFENSTTYIANESIELNEENSLVAVNSFGFNGCNGHIVLEKHLQSSNSIEDSFTPIRISARSNDELEDYLRQILADLYNKHYTNFSIADVGFTLTMRRDSYQTNMVLVVNTLTELTMLIENILSKNNTDITEFSDNCYCLTETRDLLNDDITSWANKCITQGVLPSYYHQQANTVPITSYPISRQRFWPTSTHYEPIKEVQINKQAKLINVADIWREILNTEIRDPSLSFFEYGADSLQAIDMLGLIKARYDISISYEDFYNNPYQDFIEQNVQNQQQQQEAVNDVTDAYPTTFNLSCAQKRIWLMHQMITTDKNPYNVPQLIHIKGDLSYDRLKKALYNLIAQYPILRTSFVSNNGQLCQIINELIEPLPFYYKDICEHNHSDETVFDLIKPYQNHKFDLTQRYLFLCCLFKVSKDEYYLYFLIDHIIADGWSLHVISDLIFNHYLVNKYEPKTSRIINYYEFVNYEQDYLSSCQVESDRQFWRQVLGQKPPYTSIPGDKPRPKVYDHTGKDCLCLIEENSYKLIKQVTRTEGVTLFSVLVTLLLIFINKEAKDKNLLIGSIASGRTKREFEAQIGCFSNIFLIKHTVDLKQNFIQMLHDIQHYINKALSHQQIPYDIIAEDLLVDNDTSKSPVFAINISLQNFKNLKRTNSSTLSLRNVYVPNNTAKWDLQFEFIEYDGLLELRVEYATALYSELFIDNLMRRWQELVAKILSESSLMIEDIVNQSSDKLILTWE